MTSRFAPPHQLVGLLVVIISSPSLSSLPTLRKVGLSTLKQPALASVSLGTRICVVGLLVRRINHYTILCTYSCAVAVRNRMRSVDDLPNYQSWAAEMTSSLPTRRRRRKRLPAADESSDAERRHRSGAGRQRDRRQTTGAVLGVASHSMTSLPVRSSSAGNGKVRSSSTDRGSRMKTTEDRELQHSRLAFSFSSKH